MPDLLTNPLTGEILDPQDKALLRLTMNSLEEWLGHNDQQRIPVWKASKQIQKVLAAEAYGLPRASRQSETQQRVARCPRCSGRLEVVK